MIRNSGAYRSFGCLFVGCLLIGIVSGACGPLEEASSNRLDLRFARQAIDGPCPETISVTPVQPPTLDKLEVVLTTADGSVHHKGTISLSPGKAAKLSGISEGANLDLSVTGMVGDSRQWSGSRSGIDIVGGISVYADVFMTQIDDLSCTARPLHRPRSLLAAAQAGDGRVVLAGGVEEHRIGTCGDGCVEWMASAAVDLFDPRNGTIHTGLRLNTPRALASATALPNGSVLVVGGASRLRQVEGSNMPFEVDPQYLVPTYEVFLPDRGIWIEKPLPGRQGRIFHSATSLADGRVLIAGGGTDIASARQDALIFDPAAESVGEFSPIVDGLDSPRLGHVGVLVGEKVVLIGGATNPNKQAVEEFTPSGDGGTFSEVTVSGVQANLFFHDALVLPGRPDEILVAGGAYFDGQTGLNLPSADNTFIYSVSNSTGSELGSTGVARLLHRMVTLGDGRVLLAGGFTDLDLTPDASVEIFDPAGASFGQAGTDLSVARGGHGMVALDGGRALLVGGQGPEGPLASGEIFTPLPSQ
jgi:hypothetical protein